MTCNVFPDEFTPGLVATPLLESANYQEVNPYRIWQGTIYETCGFFNNKIKTSPYFSFSDMILQHGPRSSNKDIVRQVGVAMITREARAWSAGHNPTLVVCGLQWSMGTIYKAMYRGE